MKQALVIGGGAAGMSAALELSRRGIGVVLVEQDDRLGGLPNGLACKGAPRCVRCDACYPRDLAAQLRRSEGVHALTGSAVATLTGVPGDYTAVVKDTHGGSVEVKAGAIIVATGARPYDAALDPRLHYGDTPAIMTSRDVESALVREGTLNVPGTSVGPREMAVVQCVGSRDRTRGVPYCSKACCKYGFKLAKHLRTVYPEMAITFFFMDWRPLDDSAGALADWAASDDKVRLVRSRPSEVHPTPRPTVRYATPAEFVAEERFDVVMLTVGLTPSPSNRALASVLGIEVDEQGFLRSSSRGIITAGCCAGPQDIAESVEDGVAAAGAAAAVLEGRG